MDYAGERKGRIEALGNTPVHFEDPKDMVTHQRTVKIAVSCIFDANRSSTWRTMRTGHQILDSIWMFSSWASERYDTDVCGKWVQFHWYLN
jgi:hypothetical protein